MAQTTPPSITALPAVPDRADRATFSSRATAMFDAFKNVFVSQVSAVASNVYDNAVDAYSSATSAAGSASTATTQAGLATTNGAAQVSLAAAQVSLAATHANNAAASAASAALAPGTSATSTTSLTIGSGNRTLTIQAGKMFAIGQFLIVANTTNPSNYMQGQITNHNSNNGELTISVGLTGGLGTFSEWTVSLNTSSFSVQAIPAGAIVSTALNFGGF